MLTNSLILLKVVSSKGSLLPLRQRGLTPSQIALLIQEQISAGNLESSIDGLAITTSGIKLLEQYNKERNVVGSTQWILPQDCFYRDPVDQTKVVLPKKKI